jgi:beta-glucanase (GH16 family)
MRKGFLIVSTLLLLSVLCADCSKKASASTSSTLPTDTTQTPPPDVPYTLVWSDEFNGTGLPDTTKWGYDIGGNGWGNNELEYYTQARTENARQDSGHLTIEARKESYSGNNYTSARLLTKNKIAWTYGMFEIRAKIPHGNGTWPAIWLLSATDPLVWPADGEIDIMEAIGSNPNTIYGTCHNTDYFGATGKGSTTSIASSPDSFHVYKLEWTPFVLNWYVDDVQFYSYGNPTSGAAAWPYTNNFFMILNVAVGGNFGGQHGVDDSAFPQQMQVDYVRVYQKK